MRRQLLCALALCACSSSAADSPQAPGDSEPSDTSGAVDSSVDASNDAPSDVVDSSTLDASLDADAPLDTLRAAAETTKRWIGAAVDVGTLGSDPTYAATLAREFDYLTPENAMKWAPIQPSPTTWNFKGADALVDFAKAHAMHVKGHALVWHQQVPSWITPTMTAAELHAAMLDHIKTEVSHYKGRVEAWDVVNEAIADEGATKVGALGLRDSIFSKAFDASFIADAFVAAHEADPDALLFYNDYGAEAGGAKSDRVYALVKSLVDAKVPISGVGMQMHISASSPPKVASLASNMKRLVALGLSVNISEMDVQIHDVAGTEADKLAAQARVYHDVVAACVAEPGCHAVTFWGFTDAHSWIPSFTGHADEAPLPFDKIYAKKPAYFSTLDALLGK